MRHDFTWLRVPRSGSTRTRRDTRNRWRRRRSRSSTAPATKSCSTTTCGPPSGAWSSDYRLFAISNGNADLAVIGLAQYFEASLTARDAGMLKPDPRIFAMLLDRAGLRADEAVHVGDDPRPTSRVRGAPASGPSGSTGRRGVAELRSPAPEVAASSLAAVVDLARGRPRCRGADASAHDSLATTRRPSFPPSSCGARSTSTAR